MKNLIGSEKQIDWAKDILNKQIERLERRISKLESRAGKEAIVSDAKDRLVFLTKEVEIAGFIIEFRDSIGTVYGEEWLNTSTLRADYNTWK